MELVTENENNRQRFIHNFLQKERYNKTVDLTIR